MAMGRKMELQPDYWAVLRNGGLKPATAMDTEDSGLSRQQSRRRSAIDVAPRHRYVDSGAKVDGSRRFLPRQHRTDSTPLTPEIRLHLATEIVPIWKSDRGAACGAGRAAAVLGVRLAGGQALARYILDNGASCGAKTVLDFALARNCFHCRDESRRANATGVEIDDYAVAAMALNAEANGVRRRMHQPRFRRPRCRLGRRACGDVCYEREMSARVFALARDAGSTRRARSDRRPGRNYLPRTILKRCRPTRCRRRANSRIARSGRTTVYRVSAGISRGRPT